MKPLRVGDTLEGFCGGAFGRDYWSDSAHVEAIGSDWVIIRDDNGVSHVAWGDPEDLAQYRKSEG